MQSFRGGRIMKCPYCNEEMENGYLKSNHTIRWGKDIEMVIKYKVKRAISKDCSWWK